MKARIVLSVFLAVVLLLGARKLLRRVDEQDARDRELKITHHVDLADVADPLPASAPVAMVPRRTGPVLVELTFLQLGAQASAKLHPYRGHYQVLDNNGIVFTEGDAPADGSSVALVLSPSDYEVRAGRVLKRVLSLRNATSEKQAVRIVVPR